MTAELRAALEAALSDLTDDQAQAARALIDALTPAMEEPTWPGVPVIAACNHSVWPCLHTRCNSSSSRWECKFRCISTPWHQLIKPRPLTPEEYAEHGLPRPCDHVADEVTVERAIQAFREHQGDVPESMRAGLIAVGFKAAENHASWPSSVCGVLREAGE